jgi:NTP pyrophosphatase (non-canonical NTP hydrolase)
VKSQRWWGKLLYVSQLQAQDRKRSADRKEVSLSDLLRKLRVQQLLNESGSGPLLLNEYQTFAQRTDQSATSIRLNGPSFLLLGLFGEVGSLLSELKKKFRDKEAYADFDRMLLEEFGDVLWYFSVVCSRVSLSLEALVGQAVRQDVPAHPYMGGLNPSSFLDLQGSGLPLPISATAQSDALLELGSHVGKLLEDAKLAEDPNGLPMFESDLKSLFRYLLIAANAASVSLAAAAELNLAKIVSRWPLERVAGEPYDEKSIPEEKLPTLIRMVFRQKTIGKKKYVFQSWNGVNIGDRLSDNAVQEDDFRFHDVFHLSYAAILGWSPVLRSLLRLKRKSEPIIDEVQDGARAILIEEGVATWVFSHSKELDFFSQIVSLDYSLLKAIQRFVVGYEVESRQLWEWEKAILDGFKVFRQLRENGGGTVVADMQSRTIQFEPQV